MAIFISCSKDPAGSSTGVSGKINTITFVGNTSNNSANYQSKYFYNSDGSIDHIEMSNLSSNSYFRKTTYSYTNLLITLRDYDVSNALINEQRVYQNASGLVDSTVAVFGIADSFVVNHFIYDASNIPHQLMSYSYVAGSGPSVNTMTSATYSFSNGNLISVTYPTAFYSYDYYNTVSNLTPHTFGLTYSLLQNTNLLKTVYFNSAISSQLTYTFDSNNRVSTQTENIYNNGVNNGEFLTKTFTYN